MTIDRLASCSRPDGGCIMRQRWHDLLFMHWAVPAASLQKLLPPGLTVDTFDGEAYIGLVPFRMTHVTPTWFTPVPGISAFLELNVRTYVHVDGEAPGVWFFSLDAANLIATIVARAWFSLPYFFAKMNQSRTEGPDGPTEYRSLRLLPGPTDARADIRYQVKGPVRPALPDTLDHFLIERYILYSARSGGLYRGRVHHTPYPVQNAMLLDLEENMIAAAGIECPETSPYVHFARGVQVEVFPLVRV